MGTHLGVQLEGPHGDPLGGAVGGAAWGPTWGCSWRGRMGTHLGVQLEGPHGDCDGLIEKERLFKCKNKTAYT